MSTIAIHYNRLPNWYQLVDNKFEFIHNNIMGKLRSSQFQKLQAIKRVEAFTNDKIPQYFIVTFYCPLAIYERIEARNIIRDQFLELANEVMEHHE